MSFNLQDYEPVEDRIARFYGKFPGGRIITDLVTRGENDWVVKSTVFRGEEDLPAATGYAQEIVGSSPVNKTSALENCETSAIGRALANLGFAAKGRASREEMEKVNRQEATWLTPLIEEQGESKVWATLKRMNPPDHVKSLSDFHDAPEDWRKALTEALSGAKGATDADPAAPEDSDGAGDTSRGSSASSAPSEPKQEAVW